MKQAFDALAELEQQLEKQEVRERAQEKRETHETFDRLWDFLPVNNAKKQEYRSVIYRVWGAVLAAELDNVDGVNNPHKGGQHISTMSSEHQKKCRDFVEYLLRTEKGRILHIAKKLSDWSQELPNPATLAAVNRLPFIITLRTALGICSDNKPATAPAKAPIAAKAPVPAKTASAPVKERVIHTSEEHFIEGLVASTKGNTDRMLHHFRIAADRNHAEAAWFLWKHLDETAENAAAKTEALPYLDIACRGLYWLASLKVQELYRQEPPVATPYLTTLIEKATQENAPFEALSNLGSYYSMILDNIEKTIECYDGTIATNHKNDAKIHLSAIYAFNPSRHCVTNAQALVHYNIAKNHIPKGSKGYVSFQMQAYEMRSYLATFSDENRHKWTTGEKNIYFHIHQLVSNYTQNDRKHRALVDESLTYLIDLTQYLTGSKGDDSECVVNFHAPILTPPTIRALYAHKSPFFLMSFYDRIGHKKNVEYWKQYLQDVAEDVQPVLSSDISGDIQETTVTALEKLLTKDYKLMQPHLQVARAFNPPVIIVTLSPELSGIYKKQALERSIALGVPFVEKNGFLHLKTTIDAIEQGYDRYQMSRKPKIQNPSSALLGTTDHIPMQAKGTAQHKTP